MSASATPVTLAAGEGDVAALTVDDGPHGPLTDALLDLLAEFAVPAVFCVVGENVATDEGARLVRRTVAEGHLLGNHAMTYADLGGWSPERVEADLRRVNLLIGEALADPTPPVPYFRAPNGSWGRSAEVAVSMGMQPLGVVNTIDDWRTQHVPTLVANLRAAIRPGELFVVHDGGGDRSGTLAALRVVLAERLAQGWSFTLPAQPAAGRTGAFPTPH